MAPVAHVFMRGGIGRQTIDGEKEGKRERAPYRLTVEGGGGKGKGKNGKGGEEGQQPPFKIGDWLYSVWGRERGLSSRHI